MAVGAERAARPELRRLSSASEAGGWARRVASANIDLSLALLAANKPDEAAGAVWTAILSGRIVPSNYWRAAEVVQAIEERGLPEAGELRDAYETMVAHERGRARALDA
jgi:hypothetical protein